MEVLALNFIVVSGAVLASSAVAVVEATHTVELSCPTVKGADANSVHSLLSEC